jgi:hypothetical protein
LGECSGNLLTHEGHILTGVRFDGRHAGLRKDVREQLIELVLLLRQTVFRMLPHHPLGHFAEGEHVVSDAADPCAAVLAASDTRRRGLGDREHARDPGPHEVEWPE